jgi:pimeloyl-ACP methyl ester carboxylesterase
LPDGIFRPDRLTPEFVEGIVASVRRRGRCAQPHPECQLAEHQPHDGPVDRQQTDQPLRPSCCGAGTIRGSTSDALKLSEEIPDSRLVPVDASHWIPYDAPAEFGDAVVEFLQESRRADDRGAA